MRRAGLMWIGAVGAIVWAVWIWSAPQSVHKVAKLLSFKKLLECSWEMDQRFAFDVAVDAELTLNEAALAPMLPGRLKTAAVAAHTDKSTATGWLDAKVISVTSSGEAIVAVHLASWTSDAPGTGAFPAVDRDMLQPYLLRVDSRCHVLATARPRQANVIAYRRVLGIVDRMDFSLPPADSDLGGAYTSRQIDDFGWHSLSNQYRGDDDRGSIERKRLGYEKAAASANSLPIQFRIRASAGTVSLGDSTWFAQIADSEDIETVSNGSVPFRSRSHSKLTAQPADPHAFDNISIVVGNFIWNRPSEAELHVAHEALRGDASKGLAAGDAVAQFLALRDGGVPGAWHDAQRMLRDWMRANPDGVRELANDMARGRYSRKDQADLVLAMAKSGSAVARHELEELVRNSGADHDLRVQAASACGDLKEPTTETVAVLKEVGDVKRAGTPEDILPSTATMALGSIIENAPSAAAGIEARQVLHAMLEAGEVAKTVEVLYAASNSGDKSFLPKTKVFAASEQAEERAAAAHSVRKMYPSGETEAMLNSLMRDDVHPEVVKQVAESRREQLQTYGGDLSAGELSLYGTKLASAPEGVRWEILRTLGAASRLQPVAKGILVDWYASEPVGALKVLIGQYVPAKELRVGSKM